MVLKRLLFDKVDGGSSFTDGFSFAIAAQLA
jgi:hypothetical protein